MLLVAESQGQCFHVDTSFLKEARKLQKEYHTFGWILTKPCSSDSVDWLEFSYTTGSARNLPFIPPPPLWLKSGCLGSLLPDCRLGSLEHSLGCRLSLGRQDRLCKMFRAGFDTQAHERVRLPRHTLGKFPLPPALSPTCSKSIPRQVSLPYQMQILKEPAAALKAFPKSDFLGSWLSRRQ